MKLVLCRDCLDIFSLRRNEVRKCSCGKCSGRYIDSLYAEYAGEPAVPIGFSNPSLVEALRNQPEEGPGKEFRAFVIPKKCETMTKLQE